MSKVIELPSGLKPSVKFAATKIEFFERIAEHSPYNKMSEKKRKKEIEKDWKVFSKALEKPKISIEKEEGQ